MRTVWISLALAALAAGASAQSLGLGKHDSNAPIQVSANSFEADMNAKTGTYIGNVIVVQGDMKLRADKVRVNVKDQKPEQILAFGNVVMTAPSGNAQGDNGVYDVRPRLVTLTGHVILTKQKNVMHGNKLVVNIVTGVANLSAGGGPGSTRVQGLFTPPPASPAPQKQPPKPHTQTPQIQTFQP